MAPVTSSANGLSYLTQSGGPLSNLPAPISASTLESATPQDLVSLSASALQTQEVDGLLGLSQGTQSALPGSPVTSQQSSGLLPGVSAADLAAATPQEQATINDQAALLQQVLALFNGTSNTAGTVNMIG
jgi:hypothetical protein